MHYLATWRVLTTYCMNFYGKERDVTCLILVTHSHEAAQIVSEEQVMLARFVAV